MGKLPANRATKAYDIEMKRILNNAPRQPPQQSTDNARRSGERDLSQAEKFAQAAREHGADQDEDAFKGVLRKLAKPKAG